MATPTPEQITKVEHYLPDVTADPDVWDEAKITERWAGIAGTVRAYWYQRTSDTAQYLDIPDPSGVLPITQIHRQAKEMLDYWDLFISKFGTNADPSTMSRAVTFGKIKRRYPRQGINGLSDYAYYSPYPRT